jgi:hypothetical protein
MTAPAPRPPDLQALIEAHGGFDLVPTEAWSAYATQVAQFHAARRAELERELSAAGYTRKPPKPRKAGGAR